MDISPLQSTPGMAHTAKARVRPACTQGHVPVESFQSVTANPSPGVNMKDAMYMLFGGESPVETLWKMEPDGFRLERGTYHGPAPLMSDASIFKGDQTTYRRINQVSGQPEWEFKLGKNEEFVNCKPVITKENLLGLLYHHYENPHTHEGAVSRVLVLDTKTGKEVFRTDGSDQLYDGIHTDGQGNIYCSTVVKHQVLRVSPSGEAEVLGEFGQGSYRFLCDMKVTSDGTVYYPYTNSNRMVRLKNGRERESVVDGTIDKFHPLDNGKVVVLSRYCQDRENPSMVTCLGKMGKPLWKKPVREEFAYMTVADDGTTFILHNKRKYKGDSEPGYTAIECVKPDGKTAWTHEVTDPELNDSWPWFGSHMRVSPTGDLLVMAPQEGKVFCLDPGGNKKWHFAPEYWASIGVQYSITKDEKMFVLHNGSMAKLDLATGKTELEYNRGDDTLTRYREGADPEVTKLNSADGLHFQGIVLERDDHHLFTFDEEGRFCALELPTPGRDQEENDGEIHAGSAADKVEVIDDYIVIDGVMMPINKNNSPGRDGAET